MVAISELQRNVDSEPQGRVFTDLSPQELQAHAIRRNEGVLTVNGVLSVKTNPTGRSESRTGTIVNDHSGPINFTKTNQPISLEDGADLTQRAIARLGQGDSFVHHGFIRSDIDTVIPVEFASTAAWNTLFMNNLLVRREQVEEHGFSIEEDTRIMIISVPDMKAGIAVGEEVGDIAVALTYDEEGATGVKAGSEYAGSDKKKVFTAANRILPERGILTVHGSLNVDKFTKEPTIFLGLSGTGKTTLSNDPNRILIGDDEHGISSRGAFNLEGGSYAKVKKLSEAKEPLIYKAVQTPGAVLENVELNVYREPIYATGIENMRAAYPIDFIEGTDQKGVSAVPNRMVLLTADEGILPAVAKLTPEQALYHLFSGYTAKMPGTVVGVDVPIPDFSAFFGKPFLSLSPAKYGELYAAYLQTVKPEVYLVNTGWQGGYDPDPDRRRDSDVTRRVIDAINTGALKTSSFHQDELGFYVPDGIAGVPESYLDRRYLWDNSEYDAKARKLVADFDKNIQQFVGMMPRFVMSSGPRFT